ncbi:hypothetical protein EYZ11_012748 [Aspergillus tanneri]|uniref:Uncharacterized protein n=1 Tax=Aspergillus tanneri TaxID=1220188 RepID=A0A4S3IZP7_9EURO|nr:hypothetical protein EYZ11_012748 [Aspergillus tanneri]
MVGYEWREEEKSIILTSSAHQSLFGEKVRELQKEHNLGDSSRSWSKIKVYDYIDQLSIFGLSKLFKPTPNNQEIANRVSPW